VSVSQELTSVRLAIGQFWQLLEAAKRNPRLLADAHHALGEVRRAWRSIPLNGSGDIQEWSEFAYELESAEVALVFASAGTKQ
jgi:hypothetical protein